MKNTTTIISIIIVIIALLSVAFFVHKSSFDGENSEGDTSVFESPSLFSGSSFFELNDYEGNEINSGDFKEDILVINAWATWCPFCVNELPDFAKLQQAFKESVAVVAINRAEPITTAQSFSESLDLGDSITFLVDPDDKFYKSIGGFSMPETLFVSRKGEILLHKRGPMKFEEMSELISSFLEE